MVAIQFFALSVVLGSLFMQPDKLYILASTFYQALFTDSSLWTIAITSSPHLAIDLTDSLTLLSRSRAPSSPAQPSFPR